MFAKELPFFLLPALALLIFSPTLLAADIFTPKRTERPFGYYNTDAERHEVIDASKHESTRHYSNKHKRIAAYLISKQDPIASDAMWESEQLLRIGVVRRSLVDPSYFERSCHLIKAFGLSRENITVRIIYLPSLIAFEHLEVLFEGRCSG